MARDAALRRDCEGGASPQITSTGHVEHR